LRWAPDERSARKGAVRASPWTAAAQPLTDELSDHRASRPHTETATSPRPLALSSRRGQRPSRSGPRGASKTDAIVQAVRELAGAAHPKCRHWHRELSADGSSRALVRGHAYARLLVRSERPAGAVPMLAFVLIVERNGKINAWQPMVLGGAGSRLGVPASYADVRWPLEPSPIGQGGAPPAVSRARIAGHARSASSCSSSTVSSCTGCGM
jgi:hypothetical protein